MSRATIKPRPTTKVALSAILLVCFATSTNAAPKHKPSGAVKAWKRGRALFEAGKYRQALDQFGIGYRVSGRGGFLFNMAESARLAGDAKRARELYREYLGRFAKGSQVANAQRRCAGLGAGSCEPLLPAVAPPAPSPGSTTTPKKEPATTNSQWSEPWANKQPPTAAKQPSATDLVPTQQPSPAEETSRPFYKHWGFWTGVGAVLVAGSVTAIVLATRSSDGPGSNIPVVDFRD